MQVIVRNGVGLFDVRQHGHVGADPGHDFQRLAERGLREKHPVVLGNAPGTRQRIVLGDSHGKDRHVHDPNLLRRIPALQVVGRDE